MAAIEKHHEERYLKLLANIEKGEARKKVGKKAPETCPVCNHPQAYFQVEAENY